MRRKNKETEESGRMIVGRGEKIFRVVNNCFMVLLMLITLYPLLYVLFASLSDPVEFGKVTGLLWKPAGFSTRGYEAVLNSANIWLGFRNTIFYVVVGTACSMGITILGAYPLSRKGFLLKKPIMLFIIFTMFFSGGMIPMYLTVQQLHIYNTTWAMVLPVAVSAYNLIVCRSFFESGIPVELLEAAKIDGCSDFGFFFKIAIPLSKTIIAVMCLFYATAMWNQFFNALMFLQDDSKMPLQVVLRNLVLMNQSNQMGSSASEMVTKQKLAEQLKYCVVVVSAFPLLCVYPFLQKYFAKGVTIGAVKG